MDASNIKAHVWKYPADNSTAFNCGSGVGVTVTDEDDDGDCESDDKYGRDNELLGEGDGDDEAVQYTGGGTAGTNTCMGNNRSIRVPSPN